MLRIEHAHPQEPAAAALIGLWPLDDLQAALRKPPINFELNLGRRPGEFGFLPRGGPGHLRSERFQRFDRHGMEDLWLIQYSGLPVWPNWRGVAFPRLSTVQLTEASSVCC
jgi:hypothetical protein